MTLPKPWLDRLRDALYLNYTAFFILVIVIIPFKSFSQLGDGPDNPFTVNVVPPSPEASALAKYADIPVSLYAGIPQVSIPLYELRERELTLPITLSYHGSGHKTSTLAQRTGLDFTLLAEGVVTRTLRGWPDENSNNGFLYQAQHHQISDFALGYKPADQQFLWYDAMAEGCMDIEPDQFYFNVAGYTGKFMFNWDGGITIVSEHNLKIAPLGLNIGAEDFIDGWQITAEDGTVFIFDVIETVDVMSAADHSLSCSLGLNEANIPQSWYLREMRSANKQSWVKFEYDNYIQQSESWSMELQVHNAALAPASPTREKLQTKVYGKYLKKITTSSGQTTVEFLPGGLRTDVGSSTLNTLGQVVVKNNRDKTIKKWLMEYNYSSGKLMLDKLTEITGTIPKPPYTFTYYNGTLPEPLTFSQDHWGFYNNNPAQTMIPATRAYAGAGTPVNLSGAERSPSPDKVIIGMLKQVAYPTGGKDILEFQPHDYSFEQNQELITQVVIPRSRSGVVPDSDTPSGSVDVEEQPFTLNASTYITYNAWFTYGAIFGGGTLAYVSFAIKRSDNTNVLNLAPGGAATQGPGGEIIPQQVYLTDSILLQAGNYKFVVTGKMGDDAIGKNFVSASIGWKEGTGQIVTSIRQGGGVRIAKITRSYGNGNPDKVTRYVYRVNEDGREKSSGSLLESGYRYEQWIKTYVTTPTNTVPVISIMERFFRFSQNRTALGTTQGSHVGYGLVTVLQGENGENGKTTYQYNSPREVTDYVSWNVPYPPASSYDYKRGLLIEQTDYHSSGLVVKKINNNYRFYEQQVPAIKVGWKLPGDQFALRGAAHLDRYALGNYSNILGYSRLRETKETSYNPSPAVPEEKTSVLTYKENGHKQLIQIAQTTSGRDSTITLLTYPDDYASGTSVELDTMKRRNMSNQIVEKIICKKNNISQVSLLSAIKTDFSLDNSTRVLPLQVNGARITDPVLTTTPRATANSLYETRLIFHQYDSYGNVIEHAKKDGTRTSYLWGEMGTLPLAKVDNARATQIFHTSFEEDNAANTLNQKTGLKSKAINGTFAIPTSYRPTINGDYILSYWTKEGSADWSYHEKAISNYVAGSSIVTDLVNGFIDEIRLYPKGAQMTTYTYEPLVGPLTTTDPNNIITYYDYDDFNRLKCIRDHDKNIVQCYDYLYREAVPYAVQN